MSDTDLDRPPVPGAAPESELDRLRRVQVLHTLILNSSRDCIVVLDLDGNTLFVSPGGLESMEIVDVRPILGLSWLRVWTGDDHAAATEAVAAARAGGTGRFQGFCPTHRGTPKWWDVVISPLPGADGRPERLVSVGRDITAGKMAEAKLHEVNATLERRVEERTRERDRAWKSSRDLQAVVGADGLIRAANGAWTSVLGWLPEEVVGQFHQALEHADDRAASAQARSAALRGEVPSYETRCLHKDGSTRWISWVTSAEAGVTYASGRHVTLEKEAADELARMQEQLRQSQKMEAVGQLTGGLAHDFNNLLTGITGSLELMQRRLAQGETQGLARYIGAAQGAAKRAAALTHRLLAFSRRQTLDPKPTDVNHLVEELQELVGRTVGPAIALELTLRDGLWTTQVDPNQLENALLNLCLNARDAMPEGGRLTIATDNTWLDGATVPERELVPGDYVTLSVTDTGSGMPPSVLERAFEPFFTTKPLGQGTGLGLSMIYGFARQSGGQVRIASEVGRGTRVSIDLPRHLGLVGAAPEAAAAGAGPSASHGETILVVDDEPTLRMLVCEVLGQLGYATIEAPDGPTGLALIRSGTRIDLLVTDVGLPGGMNGRQLADAARAERPGLKVLFITGFAEADVLAGGSPAPDMQIMTKPFPIDALGERVMAMLAVPS